MKLSKKENSTALIQERKKKARIILERLNALFPGAHIALNYSSPWELLVAVMLSAQCTDKKVNEVTNRLFAKYHTLNDYVYANPVEFEKDIFQTGFYRAKTRHVLATAKIVEEKFHGRVPDSIADLTTLPGVARKTANVVLGTIYHRYEGIAVDTHVKRLARVFGLTYSVYPDTIERDLMEVLPKKEWYRATYLFIEYGRAHCTARVKNHKNCPLAEFEQSH